MILAEIAGSFQYSTEKGALVLTPLVPVYDIWRKFVRLFVGGPEKGRNRVCQLVESRVGHVIRILRIPLTLRLDPSYDVVKINVITVAQFYQL